MAALQDAQHKDDAPVEVFALDALARAAALAGNLPRARSLSAAADRRMDAASHFITQADSGLQPITGRSLVPIFKDAAPVAGKLQPSRDYLLIGQERHDPGRPDFRFPGRPFSGARLGIGKHCHRPAGTPEGPGQTASRSAAGCSSPNQ